MCDSCVRVRVGEREGRWIGNYCGISLCPRTIQKKVKEGKIGCSPQRRGPKGNIPELHYNNLCAAFESFVTINQTNGNMRTCSGKKYGPLILQVVYVHLTSMVYI